MRTKNRSRSIGACSVTVNILGKGSTHTDLKSNTHMLCYTIYGLLVSSGAKLAIFELGVVDPPSHTCGLMGIALTRLYVSMPSSIMPCGIGCQVLGGPNQVLPVFCVSTPTRFEKR